MKQRKFIGPGRRFQTRIFLYLMIFSCIPVLALGLLQQTMTSQMLRSQLVGRKQTEFTNIQHQLDELVEQQELNLEQLVHDEDVLAFLSGQTESVYRVNYKLQLIFGADKERITAYVVPVEKQAATGTKELPDDYQFPYSELNWGIFRKLNNTTGPVFHINGRRASGVSGTVFSLARSVQADGEITGYIIIDITDAALEVLFADDISEKGNAVYLCDDWGFVCYSSGSRLFQGRSGLPDYLLDISEELSEARLPGGELIGIVWQQNMKTGLTMIGEVPFYHSSEMMEALRYLLYRLLLICLILSAVAAMLTANEIVSPLNIIMKHIRKIQQGDFATRIDSGRKDEFGTVMKAFDEMTEKLVYYLYVVEEKQKNLRLAEIKNLQAQIRPHFLYNTLDLIKWNIRLGETERAVTMLTDLGKLLRSTIDCNDYVRVDEEIEIVRRYLAIQTVHYNDNLSVEWELEEDIGELMIPKLILQPIVENSVIHGLSPGRMNNWIKISCRKEDGYLIFHVVDNGMGIPAHKLDTICSEESPGGSIGISNVHSRLTLFGDETCGVFYQDCSNGANVRLVCKILEPD